ncbi:peptide deformylase [Hippea sp. KM1]|uniref:peptide deformylase n=1 Tax=Hippea sp. KM1 TaxID=944481 RepID=UPI00046D585F|nr:peptide deformylase [Hippea sp. KM1]
MPVRDIVIYPDQRLKTVCDEIRNIDEKTLKVAKDLLETMRYYNHTVGIAAPQIGELVRIIAVDASKNKKGQKINHGELVMINPEILDWSSIIKTREGCLSVPDYTGNVNRARKITVKYWDLDGKEHQFDTEGFEAVVIQHEIDHLDGILFIDRIISKRTDLFRRKNYG